MKLGKKGLSLIFSLCFVVIICPAILDSVAKAQEQSACPSGQVRDSSGLCSSSNQGQESESMANAQEFFQKGREFDIEGQHQEALFEYTRAIELDPNYVEAYFYRGNALALEGQPQKGIEDLQKAAAILEYRGQLEWAAAMRQHEEIIREGIQEGEF
ncbi:MAG: tetratricopeptide repeat protein [Komarekiella atlantica HA4396-MV6]|jgi:tetratricopeptide (TPR) repeat protein|nr:tetratricopeptide repeat protein [Komarekiella atlantica HA4396-MV6]